MSGQITRRQFLHYALVGSVGLTGVFLAACGGGSSATSTTAASKSSGTTAAATPTQMGMAGMTMTATGSPSVSQASPVPTTSGSGTPAASTAASTGSTSSAQAAVKIVEPSLNYQTWTYEPNDLHVPVGTKVVWTNTGGAAHTVTSDDKKSFDSGAIQPGAQFSHVMDTAGTFPYHCTFHPFMKGTVTVTG